MSLRQERGVTVAVVRTTRIIREYYEQIYANKCNNLYEMENSPENFNLVKLRQEETENMKISMYIYYGT